MISWFEKEMDLMDLMDLIVLFMSAVEEKGPSKSARFQSLVFIDFDLLFLRLSDWEELHLLNHS